MSTGKLRLFFAIMVVVTVSLIALAQEPIKPHSYDALVNTVERLERRLTQLEDKVRQLEQKAMQPK